MTADTATSETSPEITAPPAPRAETATRPVEPAPAGTGRLRSRRSVDLIVGVTCLLGGLIVMSGLWADPNGRGLSHNGSDQVFFEWMLGYTAHAITHLTNPFWTTLLNAPVGVNIASNTAVTAIGIALTPVTLLFGTSVAFVTALTLNLALTGYVWYWLFSRHVARTRTAAVVGGIFCGFAPGIIAHANGHLNFTAGWLIPLLLWRLIRLTRGDSRVRDGVWVGVLTAIQYSIGAEMLFFLGIAVAVYAVAWAVQRRAAARVIASRVWRRLAVAVPVAAVLLAYPVWMQFAGPQAYRGSGYNKLGVWENVLSFGAIPWASLAGQAGLWAKLARNYGEENSFLGPLLVIGAVVYAWRLSSRKITARRSRPATLGRVEAKALSITALVIAFVALGPRLQIAGWHSHIPLLWGGLQHLPFFDAALPGRFALLLIPAIALLMVSFIDDVSALPKRHRGRTFALILGVGALLPLVPVPLPAEPRAALPRFITSGDWRAYLPAGTTMISIPPSTWDTWDAQRWQTVTDDAFGVPGGYFLGRGPDGRSILGALPRPSAEMFTDLVRNGDQPVISSVLRTEAQEDLAFWHAGLVVLPDATPGQGHEWAPFHNELLAIGKQLYGAPQRVDDVWLWQVPQVG